MSRRTRGGTNISAGFSPVRFVRVTYFTVSAAALFGGREKRKKEIKTGSKAQIRNAVVTFYRAFYRVTPVGNGYYTHYCIPAQLRRHTAVW